MTQKVTPRQRKAIRALLTTATVAEAARVAGVKRQTIYRWMKEERFRLALAGAEREALESLSRALVRLGDTATKTLGDAMTAAESESVKVRASDIVLSRLLQLRELVDLHQRVEALEKANLGGGK